MANSFESIFSSSLNVAQSFMAGRLFKQFGKYLPGPAKIMFLLKKTYDEQGADASIDGIAKDLFEKTKLLGQFIAAYFKNEYREIETWKAIAIIAALAYVVSPLDVIPDGIPIIGFMDDISILSWLLSNLNDELDRFQYWAEVNASYEFSKAQ